MLPESIGRLTALQALDLSNNRLSALPEAIGELTALQTLNISSNALTELPEAIGRLTGLQTLNISSNALTELPEAIGRLTGLQALNLSNNRLSAMPEAIGQLTALQTLNVSDNHLTALPDSIGRLTALQTLHASHYSPLSAPGLRALPASIGRLTALQTLGLRNNELTALPEAIGELAMLQSLDLIHNRLASLPISIESLKNLNVLLLADNPDLKIPPEIVGPEFPEAQRAKPRDILRFYFFGSTSEEQGPQSKKRLNEAKILIVGQGAVGKTSLVNRLIHDSFHPDEKKTEGINIETWMITPSNTPSPAAESEPVRLNVWDFGGQEIMHATHQFFLTKRSLYLLVIDARKGENESNINYWLKIIQSYGADSPVYVVTNKTEDHFLDLNENRLAKDYAPNLRGFFGVSCATGKGIAELRKALIEGACALPHIFDELPESYFKVKEILVRKAKTKDFIDKDEYQRICSRNDIKDLRDQNLLLRFLHDLGNVLNFDDPDDPYDLHDTNILNPEWVTGGVYKLINSVQLAHQQGRLEREQLAALLNDAEKYPLDKHSFLIEIMRKFELCFQYPDAPSRRWLIPELLPKNEPDLPEFESTDSLRFQYHYNILPSGIMCRFIVKMHCYLTKRPTYWRSGVVPSIEGSRTLVRGDSDSGKVFITVLGPDRRRRSALAIVRSAFREIHDTIPKLVVKGKVPLPDQPDIVVDFEHLLRLEELRLRDYVPEGADRRYDVINLLDGVT